MGQRLSQPTQHRPLGEGLFHSESFEEDKEISAGRTQMAISRMEYVWLNPPDTLAPEKTLEASQALAHQQRLHGIILHYTG